MIFILTSIQEDIELFFGVYTELFTVSKLSQFCHCQDILKFQSLIGNVQQDLTIENIQFKESMFQSLIGNVQHEISVSMEQP